MRIDGIDNVKERIEIFNRPDSNFITYKYIFENENYYNDTVDKWKQKDFGYRTIYNVEDRLMNKYIKEIKEE